MIFLIILFYIFFVSPISAAPQVSIINYPASVIVGETFPITFNVFSADIGTIYHYKIVGDTATDISIFPSCASKYDDCLNLTILDSLTNQATAYAKINIQNSSNNLKIRLAQSDQHSKTYDSAFVSIASLIPSITPTQISSPTPEITASLSPEPTNIIPSPTNFINPLIITEIMANPETDQDEWMEIYNPSAEKISLKDLCFYDASNHSRCFADTEYISPNSYYFHSFSSGFLNNDGDTVNFLSYSIIYPKSPKNYTYSRQGNNSWCFSHPTQNADNSDCLSFSDSASKDENYTAPDLKLQFLPGSVSAGADFNLVFSLNSADQYFLRLIYPFSSQYFPFTDYRDGYSWLTMPLSISKKLPPGSYPLSFHLKKNGSSHLYDYQLGNLVVSKYIDIKSSSSKNKVLGAAITPIISTCPPQITSLNISSPDLIFFSWPFLFAGSILFLSPILFPKLYSA